LPVYQLTCLPPCALLNLLYPIKFNTYGDLPNSDLLRRYGHVDLVPCSHLKGALGNPQDIVEIRADLVVKVVCGDAANDEKYQQRIDWWLDEGGDEYVSSPFSLFLYLRTTPSVFIIDMDAILPVAMMSLIRLLLLPKEDWEKTREKGRPPKAKFDRQVSCLLRRIFETRLSIYQSPDLEVCSSSRFFPLKSRWDSFSGLG